MKVFYSAKINGFIMEFTIISFQQNGKLPDDLVEITEEEHDMFLAGMPGHRMIPSKDGKPIWIAD